MILNSEDTDDRVLIRKMQKEELITAWRVRMVHYGRETLIVRLGTCIVIIHISNKHADNLH